MLRDVERGVVLGVLYELRVKYAAPASSWVCVCVGVKDCVGY